eukprot:1166244-Amphidinium_carterae.1
MPKYSSDLEVHGQRTALKVSETTSSASVNMFSGAIRVEDPRMGVFNPEVQNAGGRHSEEGHKPLEGVCKCRRECPIALL